MRKLIALTQVAMLAMWESCFLHFKEKPIATNSTNKDAEAFPKTEASFLSSFIGSFSKFSFIQEGSFPKTVIPFFDSRTTLRKVNALNCLFIIFLSVASLQLTGQDPVPGCDIGVVPDDLDMQNRIQVNLDDTCTSCGPYGGDNGSPGQPPMGQTGCAVIQITEQAMTECMTLIVDPQSTEKTNYYFDYNLMVDDCFMPDGTTENQGETVTFMRDELILNNGFYSLVVCSQSTGNRFYQVVFGCCPNPGEDTSVDVCNGETELIDLFSQFVEADPGGTWERETGSGGDFDALAGTFEVMPGTTSSIFKYTVEADPDLPDCDLTSFVTVNIVGPNAGVGSEITVCQTSIDAIDLSSLLTGADPGGAWSRETGSGGVFDAMAGTFVPGPDGTTSTFSYNLEVDPQFPQCSDDSAIVTVNLTDLNSGEGSEITVCDNSMEIIDLATLLTGADPGGKWDRESGTGGMFNKPNGTFQVTPGATSSTFSYTVGDPNIRDCFSTTIVAVNIGDVLEPEVICDNIIVALSFNDPEIIDADSLVESMSDECGEIVSVQALRILDPLACNYLDIAEPADSVAFCCEDVGQSIMVQIFVTDDSGNVGSCMALVTVADNVPPLIMTCVDDITVSCYYDIDLEDLSEFGMMEAYQEDVDEIILIDKAFNGSGQGGKAYDGMYLDNCPDGTTIREVIDDQRECNKGDIKRKFILTDGSGGVDSCTQTITVIDLDRIGYDDIMWPGDVPYEDCNILNPNPGPTPHPDETGWPTYKQHDICSQPTASYSDLIFDDPTSGCIKVQRRWKVIDWCYYDKDTKEGSWIYYQYIKIINLEAPTFDDDRDTIQACTPGASCAGIIPFEITATDDCTADEDLLYWYEFDTDNDGSIDDEGTANSFSIFLEKGTHRVKWKVEDRCGNYTRIEQIIEVKECKAPTPICLWGLAASLSEEGESVIWAIDFNNKSNDNCTEDEDLVFSFSSDTSNTSITLDCGDLGELPIELWVTDECGNQAYCETYIDVQDNHVVCNNGMGDMMRATVAGSVYTENNLPLKDAQVNISGPELDHYQMTNSKGEYAFESLDMNYNYEIIPVKDDNPLDGVSTLDLVMVQQHILGIRPLESPYKKIAADVNNSESISAIDLIQLRKMILGLYDAFPENNSWRFVESEYGILETDKPWPFVEGMYVENLNGDIMNNDFVAIKIGDVNNSVEEKINRNTVETRSSDGITITSVNQLVKKGQTVDVTLSGSGLRQMVALQWTVTADSDFLDLKGWQSNNMKVAENNIGVIDGEGQHITFAWTDLQPQNFNDGRDLLTLSFKVLADTYLADAIQFGSTITPAAGYNADYEKLEVEFAWIEKVSQEVVLYQNAPNPFLDKTSISFELPKAMDAQIEVFDVSGKIMYRKNDFYNQGKNTIFVTTSELDGLPGVVYYTLKTEYSSITKKMILLR